MDFQGTHWGETDILMYRWGVGCSFHWGQNLRMPRFMGRLRSRGGILDSRSCMWPDTQQSTLSSLRKNLLHGSTSILGLVLKALFLGNPSNYRRMSCSKTEENGGSICVSNSLSIWGEWYRTWGPTMISMMVGALTLSNCHHQDLLERDCMCIAHQENINIHGFCSECGRGSFREDRIRH